MYADCDERILKYAADYRINLITLCRLSDDELDEFHTNFREVMKYIKYSSDGKKLKEAVNSDARFKNVERQAVDLINAVTSSKVKYSEREEKIDMCVAIREIKEEGRQEGILEGRQEGILEGRQEGILEGRQEGILEGRQEGILEGRQEGILEGRQEGEIIGVIRTYKKMQFSYEDTERYIIEEYQKSEEEADELIKMYWK